ncbi:thioredoxin reductase (NADPH) [Amycolatopsis bartoniae]|uniref:Putative FAD-dependent pyridine nucleotide-disulphide oxidoreductase n=1 Tax=Amycolatopsis bartoniae TaxID=941986 RepID=A0A8H9IVC7_9PSEU|nr:NAD(P)/FAD-dependent oxidoreductase [Amycolatopsis bartoniae]MBB2939015.1 thioredoxin reductase (NADPH) [Amycolatopsis bartoniae]TVT04270.1 NAD(P)/FAD-dependent oxidoreductase [Amycolatopsis bartoniae]GHF65582.1 putative FAD-dependent pyridine nucleotide-disulphide oxidoreductase [Amycolatopsis bartoniae]
MRDTYDVVVIGGGAAGLGAALALTRSRRSVLVVDAGQPRNAPAAGIHNYLGREGTPPRELLEIGRDEVAGYGGEFVSATATGAEALPDKRFRVTLDDGRHVRARRLLVTTGLVDELPAVPGVAQRWGTDVLHCPYCHGWEARDQAVGILATGPLAGHQALLWRQLTEDVIVFRHTAPDFDAETLTKFAARGIRVVDGTVAGLEVRDDHLTGVRLESGEVVPRQALVVAPRFTARSELLVSLGLEPVEQQFGEQVLGTYVPADPTGRTTVPGVWVAGNVTNLSAQVVVSAAAGLGAGAAINADLIEEETDRAVAAHTLVENERVLAETVSGNRRHGM